MSSPSRRRTIDYLVQQGREQGNIQAWVQLRRDFFSHSNGDFDYLEQQLSNEQMLFLERLPIERMARMPPLRPPEVEELESVSEPVELDMACEDEEVEDTISAQLENLAINEPLIGAMKRSDSDANEEEEIMTPNMEMMTPPMETKQKKKEKSFFQKIAKGMSQGFNTTKDKKKKPSKSKESQQVEQIPPERSRREHDRGGATTRGSEVVREEQKRKKASQRTKDREKTLLEVVEQEREQMKNRAEERAKVLDRQAELERDWLEEETSSDDTAQSTSLRKETQKSRRGIVSTSSSDDDAAEEVLSNREAFERARRIQEQEKRMLERESQRMEREMATRRRESELERERARERHQREMERREYERREYERRERESRERQARHEPELLQRQQITSTSIFPFGGSSTMSMSYSTPYYSSQSYTSTTASQREASDRAGTVSTPSSTLKRSEKESSSSSVNQQTPVQIQSASRFAAKSALGMAVGKKGMTSTSSTASSISSSATIDFKLLTATPTSKLVLTEYDVILCASQEKVHQLVQVKESSSMEKSLVLPQPVPMIPVSQSVAPLSPPTRPSSSYAIPLSPPSKMQAGAMPMFNQGGGGLPSSTSTNVIDSSYYASASQSCHMCYTEGNSGLACTHIKEHCFELTKVSEEQHALLIAGSGGEGMVLSATLHPPNRNDRYPHNGRHVALKALHHDIDAHKANQEKLLEEMMKLLFLSSSDSILHCYGHTALQLSLPGGMKKGYKHASPIVPNKTPLKIETSFVVMEFAPYGDLHELLFLFDQAHSSGNKDITPLPLSILLQWMCDITSGVKDMHMFSLKHRDIKPKNILIFERLKVKLGDFGLAKYHTQQGSTTTVNESVSTLESVSGTSGTGSVSGEYNSNYSSTMGSSVNSERTDQESSGFTSSSGGLTSGTTDDYTTNTQTSSCTFGSTSSATKTAIAGTRGYLAPENTQTTASDIFSLGITFVHMINHKYNPMRGWADQARLAKDKLSSYEPWAEVDEDVRERLCDVIEQMLDLNPKNRPSAEVLYDSLCDLSSDCDIPRSVKATVERNIKSLLSKR